MSDESDEHRYLFTVRQRFGESPAVDSFYELTVPSGLTGDQAKIMKKLDESWCKKEISNDNSALQGMSMRLRFNSDMYPKVCLVRTTCEITSDELSIIIEGKHNDNELLAFLDESAINA